MKQHGIGYTMTRAEIGLTGTLAELGVKVGDVVEAKGYSCAPLDGVYKICIHPEYDVLCALSDNGWQDVESSETPVWRIISRHQQSPVVDEVVTTTVKKIVPGVYGNVYVHGRDDDGKLLVGLTEETDDRFIDGYSCAPLSRDELSAAIATLTTIRDAM